MTYLTGGIVTCIDIALVRATIQFTIENHSANLMSTIHSVAVLNTSELLTFIVYYSKCGEM